MDGYTKGGHTKYCLKVHLILVTKYRKAVFEYERKVDVKQYVFECCRNHGWNIVQMETDRDHIHILLEYSVKESISDIVKQIKQYSTYRMWLKYSDWLKTRYWKKRILWSDGYFACSIGQVSQSTIEKYILS